MVEGPDRSEVVPDSAPTPRLPQGLDCSERDVSVLGGPDEDVIIRKRLAAGGRRVDGDALLQHLRAKACLERPEQLPLCPRTDADP